MNLSLPSNISKLRKEHSMTQEQLAEALGVTFASVSKWERGVATPELNLIAEMADLFGVSLDALVGFEVLNGGVAAIEKRIHDLQRQKKYDEAIIEAEKNIYLWSKKLPKLILSMVIWDLGQRDFETVGL